MSNEDELQRAVDRLPREFPPPRDLWPKIEARLARTPQLPADTADTAAAHGEPRRPGANPAAAAGAVAAAGAPQPGPGAPPLWGVAATVLLVATASLTTFVATRAWYAELAPARAAARPFAATPAPEPSAVALNDAADVQPVGGAGGGVLPLDYTLARGELMGALESSLSRLDPASQRLVEGNLREIRAALATIEYALAQDPDNASLQQLLVNTSHQEMALLKSIQRLTATTGEAIGS